MRGSRTLKIDFFSGFFPEAGGITEFLAQKGNSELREFPFWDKSLEKNFLFGKNLYLEPPLEETIGVRNRQRQ